MLAITIKVSIEAYQINNLSGRAIIFCISGTQLGGVV